LNAEKFPAETNFFKYFLGSKTTIYLYLVSIKDFQATEEASALKREHPAAQNMKFLNFFHFCGSFLPSWIWIRIRIPNPDTDPLT
jgi:hypothetical protein